ncbi:MAG: hypothetical protein ACQKBU_08605 [Verrucomicrobiales bacterium]
MLHPDLAALLQRRLDVIADHDFRDRDPEAHLTNLREASQAITLWHSKHRGSLDARLEHFLRGCSYQKALIYLESDGAWRGH